MGALIGGSNVVGALIGGSNVAGALIGGSNVAGAPIGGSSQLRCPDPTCKMPLPPHVLKEVLDEEQFQRWERLTLERTLDCMADLVYCPRCAIL